tara:strand:- start:249 stop:611 length:363 start_codon:yes stop_codon:yes gene_type:complete
VRIISFTYTTPALLAGKKSVTRHDWKEEYARQFRAGDLVQAYDRSPRAGGKRVAIIRLLIQPYQLEYLSDVDWYGEGFHWMTEQGLTLGGVQPETVWQQWREHGVSHLWVVRFQIAEEYR